MKASTLLVLATFLLASANLSFGQTPLETDEPESDVELSEPVSEPEAGAEEIAEAEHLSPADEAFERAIEHAKNNELDEAIAECTEAIRLDPGNRAYLTVRAALYHDTREFDKGFEDADKVLKADPNDLGARHLRGKLFESSGSRDKALIEFNTAVERNPTSMQALIERHNYFTRQGQHEKAAADADRMIQLQPESPDGYIARGLISTASGDGDESLNYASRVLQKNPESLEGYTMRAAARGLRRDFSGAHEDFETALKLSPDNAEVLNLRAMVYLDQGEFQKGLADMERAVELEPHNYRFKTSVADLLATCPDERLRDGKKASEYATAALKAAPDDPDVWSAYAAAAAESGNFEEAIKWQQRVNESRKLTAAQKPDSADRLKAYEAKQPFRDVIATRIANKTKMEEATDAINGGKLERAIALLSEVIDADPKKARAYTLRGIAYFRLHKHDLAIADLSAGIERDPEDRDAYYYRGGAFKRKREYAKAISDFQMLEKLPSKDGIDPLNELAWLFSTCPDDEVRDGGKASEYIDRALELRPDMPEVWDTCAAVFAENGDYDDAIEWQEAVLGRNEFSEAERERAQARLALYEKHEPYRQEPD